MLNTMTRKLIEWHFYNHEQDKEALFEKEMDIIESNMSVNQSHISSRYKKGSPTESKAIKLLDLKNRKNWIQVVENTYNAFKFEFEYDVMIDLYQKKKKWYEIIDAGLPESTFLRWRDKWLEVALSWAQEFEIL